MHPLTFLYEITKLNLKTTTHKSGKKHLNYPYLNKLVHVEK